MGADRLFHSDADRPRPRRDRPKLPGLAERFGVDWYIGFRLAWDRAATAPEDDPGSDEPSPADDDGCGSPEDLQERVRRIILAEATIDVTAYDDETWGRFCRDIERAYHKGGLEAAVSRGLALALEYVDFEDD
jgi:hypothetical protein